MIPLLIPPLTGLNILVTRPAAQAEGFCGRVTQLGGTALRLPTLDIQAQAAALLDVQYDLVIFISTNAVLHGQAILQAHPQARIAAVGAATVQALQALGHTIDISPDHAANSEALLTHPLLQTPPARVLIARGVGGRELLHDTLSARGSVVDVIEVYQRVAVTPDAAQYQQIKTYLLEDQIDVIGITSVDVLQALDALLDDEAKLAAQRCSLLIGSMRIATAARQLGWHGELIIAESPEDATMINALTRWHTRARGELLR